MIHDTDKGWHYRRSNENHQHLKVPFVTRNEGRSVTGTYHCLPAWLISYPQPFYKPFMPLPLPSDNTVLLGPTDSCRFITSHGPASPFTIHYIVHFLYPTQLTMKREAAGTKPHIITCHNIVMLIHTIMMNTQFMFPLYSEQHSHCYLPNGRSSLKPLKYVD
jgi:hypothetical protein